MKMADIGSVSHGTLKTDDLFQAFENELEWQIMRQDGVPEDMDALHALSNKLESLREEFYDEDGELLIDKDGIDEAVSELADALDQFAPPYCYFGSHAGDGSDFGFWPSFDSIEELPKFNDLSEVPDDIDEDYCVGNDHGNLSVYGSDGSLIWDCV